MQRDEEIFELIQAEKNRQLNGIELIASRRSVLLQAHTFDNFLNDSEVKKH